MDHTKVGSDNGNWTANVRTQWRALCKRCCVNGFNYHTAKTMNHFHYHLAEETYEHSAAKQRRKF